MGNNDPYLEGRAMTSTVGMTTIFAGRIDDRNDDLQGLDAGFANVGRNPATVVWNRFFQGVRIRRECRNEGIVPNRAVQCEYKNSLPETDDSPARDRYKLQGFSKRTKVRRLNLRQHLDIFRHTVVPQLSLHELIQRVRDGDSEAVGVLLNQYGDAIRREVRFSLLDQRLKRIVGESDIYQSVVSRFVFGLQDGNFEFESGKDVVNLLKVIVRARVAQHARFWKSRRRDLHRNQALLSDDAIALTESQPTIGQQQSDAELLAIALSIMPERDRKILEWRAEGLSWGQVAERLGVSSAEGLRKSHERSMQRTLREIRYASGLEDKSDSRSDHANNAGDE